MPMTIRYSAALLSALLALAACGPKQTASTAIPAADASAPAATPAPVAAETTPAAPATQTASAEGHRYETKTGRITYAVSGMQSGTETTTWDDWGARQVTQSKTTMSMGGTSITLNQRVIMTPDSFEILNDANKTVMKIDRNANTPAMGAQGMRDMSAEAMQRMGATQAGTDTVAGKSCNVYKMTTPANMTVCVWGGLPLKTEVDMQGVKISKVASSVESDVAIDPTLFEVPADYSQTATPAMPGMMQAPGAPPPPAN
jgi:hypothetical protein